MGRNWAIAIGINQYRYLQPLHYAVRDAAAMCDYFTNEMKFEQVYYFSDNSPPIQQDYGPSLDSIPTFTTLRRFLRSRFEHPFLQTGDNLWFFFAGHGIRYEDRDYLMPIDSDPGEVERTAIPISYVTDRLRRSGADNIILLIDACRNEGRRAGVGIGEEVPQGVITLFSCSPREASYEVEALEQGAFTHALLQGLRRQGESNCATVERLDQYLRAYVPDLNRRYHKPAQTPYTTVEPAVKYHLILLPQQATLQDAETLKLEAYKAEAQSLPMLAEQLWIRVLAVSPSDADAIAAIRRLARRPAEANQDHSNQDHLTVDSDVETIALKQRSLSSTHGVLQTLSRRRLLQWVSLGGLGVAGTGVAFLSRSLFPPVSPILLKTSRFNVITLDSQGKEIQQQKQAQVFAEELGGGVKLELIAIAGGTFKMGSPTSEKDRFSHEEPQHLVTVNPFLIGRYEITKTQWQKVAALPKVHRDLNLFPSSFGGAGTGTYPVESISWHEAIEFCARLSKKTGRQYRLPTEAEWEYACRAGTTTPFHFGQMLTPALANYKSNSTDASAPQKTYRQQTTDVRSFSPNAFGLHDMHGNVSEWCLDPWHENYQGAKTDGSVWAEEGISDVRVVRGGAWNEVSGLCRSAFRGKAHPDDRKSSIGLRVVCLSV